MYRRPVRALERPTHLDMMLGRVGDDIEPGIPKVMVGRGGGKEAVMFTGGVPVVLEGAHDSRWWLPSGGLVFTFGC